MRIAESLAKMKLQPFATEADVEEALRLFQVSTLDAAMSGSLSGEGEMRCAGGTCWDWLLRTRRDELPSQDRAGRGRKCYQPPPVTCWTYILSKDKAICAFPKKGWAR